MRLSFTDLQATWKIFKSFRLEIFQETVWFPSAFSPLWSCYKPWSANASCHIVGLIIGKPDGFSRSTLVIWLSQSDGACVTLCYQQPGPVGIALPSKTIRLVFALAYLSRVFSSQTKKRSDPLIVQLLLLNVGIQKHNCRMASKRRRARWPSAGAAIDPLGRSIHLGPLYWNSGRLAFCRPSPYPSGSTRRVLTANSSLHSEDIGVRRMCTN